MTGTLLSRRRCGRASRLLPAALALLPLCGVMAGCSLTAPAAVPAPAAVGAPDRSQFAQLVHALVERAQRLDTLKSEAVMEYKGGGQHVKAREEIVLKRPSSLRVEAFTPFGVAAVVAANGSTLAIYQPSENTFYRGAATAGALNRFAQIPLPPQQAIKLLMGLLPEDEAHFTSPGSVRFEDGLLIGAYQLPGGTVDELGFADGQLRLVRVDGKNGAASYEVHYSDYHDIGGLEFAHHLEASFLNTGTQLNVRYSEVIINPTLSDTEFTLVPQGSVRQIDLDQPAATGGNG